MYRIVVLSLLTLFAQVGLSATPKSDIAGKTGLQGQSAPLGQGESSDPAYYCRDGRWPVQGYCREVYLGLATDCYNVIGIGLRSNQCAIAGGAYGYPVQILDGRGLTYCDCWGAVY